MISHESKQLLLVLEISHNTLLEENLELMEPFVVCIGISLHFVFQELQNPSGDDIPEFGNER